MPQFKDKLKNIKEPQKDQERKLVSPNAGIKTEVRCDESEHFHEIIRSYKTAFGAGLGYKEPIINKDPNENKEGSKGSMSISFPNKGDAENFFISEAKKGMHMLILDQKTSKVVAYSNGDINLYHADGTHFQVGDKLKPSNMDAKDFTVPEPKNGTEPRP